MGNACGCGSERPVDPQINDQAERLRQEELAKALEDADVTPIDLAEEIPAAKHGLNAVKEVDEQSNQEEEDDHVSVDSDVIPESMIPAKIPLLSCVKDALLMKILTAEKRTV